MPRSYSFATSHRPCTIEEFPPGVKNTLLSSPVPSLAFPTPPLSILPPSINSTSSNRLPCFRQWEGGKKKKVSPCHSDQWSTDPNAPRLPCRHSVTGHGGGTRWRRGSRSRRVRTRSAAICSRWRRRFIGVALGLKTAPPLICGHVRRKAWRGCCHCR